MMREELLVLILDDFELKAKKVDEGLIIEAEHQVTSDTFIKTVNQETLRNFAHPKVFTVETIFKILQSYQKNSTEPLSLTPDGKLIYSQKIDVGPVTTDLGFTIELEKKELEANEKMEKSFNKLLLKVSKLEDRVSCQEKKASDFERNILEKLEKVESSLNIILGKIKRLEDKDGKFEGGLFGEEEEEEL